jgi:hypothetical protein
VVIGNALAFGRAIMLVLKEKEKTDRERSVICTQTQFAIKYTYHRNYRISSLSLPKEMDALP